MSIVNRTVTDHVSALEKKEYSATELSAAYLDEIEKKEGNIGAYLYCNREDVLDKARKADELLSKGEKKTLLGIPVLIKDNICTKGIPTTAASKMLEGFIPPYDATVIERLKDAGAIVLGKANMDEFAMGSTTENSAYKLTKNPLDISLTPGGSSGGCSAAVASDTAPCALGSDTGGSVRQPSAFCGCVGLRPTYGAVSRFGLIAFASSLDQIGPITKSVDDNALLFSCISGKDPRDATSKDFKFLSEGINDGIKGLKIGIYDGFFKENVSDDVIKAVFGTIDSLTLAGAEKVSVDIPSAKDAAAAYYIISSAEASSNLARYDGVRFGHRTGEACESIDELYKKSRSEGFGKEVKRRIMLGTFALCEGAYDDYYKKALCVCNKIKADFDRAFKSCDIIITPTAPTKAYPLGRSVPPSVLYGEDFLSAPASLAGLPALSVPCNRDGLPAGVQLIGPRFSESLLYRTAKMIEEAYYGKQK